MGSNNSRVRAVVIGLLLGFAFGVFLDLAAFVLQFGLFIYAGAVVVLGISDLLGLKDFAASGVAFSLMVVANALVYAAFGGIVSSVVPRKARDEDSVPRCIRCGYNLTGNESGTCSECGAKVESRL